MADQIATAEKNKYEKMWNRDEYRERSPGLRFLPDALKRLKMPEGSTVVDLGCGTGRVSAELESMGYRVTAVDIAQNACTEFGGPFVEACLWDIPAEFPIFDFGFCADVLEHIPTERVDDCLAEISCHVRKVYFQIANFECHMGDHIGEHLHLTVKPLAWWRERLERVFPHVDIVGEQKHHIAVCHFA